MATQSSQQHRLLVPTAQGSQLIFFERSAATCTAATQFMLELTKQLCRAANGSGLLTHLAGPILLWVFFCMMYHVLYMAGRNKIRAFGGTCFCACGAMIYYLGLLAMLLASALQHCYCAGMLASTQRCGDLKSGAEDQDPPGSDLKRKKEEL